MNTLECWAEEITKQVYAEWKSKYSSWKPGFKVFYSPIKKKPKLMILSLQPGGSGHHFLKENKKEFKKNNFALPKTNEYYSDDHKMATKLQYFFKDNKGLLETSVALPIIFFRSRSWKYWKQSISKNQRQEMEKLSYLIVKDIIKKVQPKSVLVVGFGTYKRIKQYILETEQEHSIKSGKHRLFLTTRSDKIPIFCIPHLTGYRLSNENLKKIRKEFFEFLQKF